MKIPQKPPAYTELLKELPRLMAKKQAVFQELLVGSAFPAKYLHWDNLRHLTPPDGLTHSEWWLGLKIQRKLNQQSIPLIDTAGRAFQYVITDPIPERLHAIDLGAGGVIRMPDEITNPETRDQYYVSSLIEEAITSSQLEGARTTRLAAKAMIRAGRKPANRSERMIFNNYLAMRRISELEDEPLTPAIVFELHRILTDGTLDDGTAAGRLRQADEHVVVGDVDGTVYHEPPAASELEERLAALCAFANGETPDHFVHPVIRSILLHFWLAYDHPFVDGNGRTARALFYWSMLRHGFWLCEFIAISEVILKGPARYYRAFLLTETDEGDLTYFVLYHLDLIKRALERLHVYIKGKTREIRELEEQMRDFTLFNHRQKAFLAHALRHPGRRYTIESHRSSHDVAYQTARTDLMDLAARGLLGARKIKKTWYYEAPKDLEERIKRAAVAM